MNLDMKRYTQQATAGQRLHGRLLGEFGHPLHDIFEILDGCLRRAKTREAHDRLVALRDQFVDEYRDRDGSW